MRFADGPTAEVETVIEAPLETVWALVSDIATPVQFSQELQDVHWLDETRFAGRSRHPAIGEWETTCVVIAREQGREFAWVVGEPAYPSSTWRFVLEPQGDRTVLRQQFRMGPAPSGLNAALEAMPDKEERIIARRLEEHRVNMQATVDGIKRLAEAR